MSSFVDPHWFQCRCGSGSNILGHCGSGSGSGACSGSTSSSGSVSMVLMIQDCKILKLKETFLNFLFKKCTFFLSLRPPRRTSKQQEKPSALKSNIKNSLFLSWIRNQLTKINADPCGDCQPFKTVFFITT
jgi:hypothetical protein